MAELLVKAIDYVNPDPEEDTPYSFKKGDVVYIAEDGGITGSGEGPPKFVVVKVPGLSAATIEDYRRNWTLELGYEIVATDAALDGARIRVYAEVPGAANEYGITQAQVEGYLTSWGASVVSTAANEVRFDVTIQNIYKSEGFWGVSPASLGVVIAETNYDQPSGVHTATIDVSGWVRPDGVDAVQKKVIESGATVVDVTGFILTVEFERVTVRRVFIENIKHALRKIVRCRQYAFSGADVDTVLAAGGVITLTPAQLAANIVDKSTV